MGTRDAFTVNFGPRRILAILIHKPLAWESIALGIGSLMMVKGLGKGLFHFWKLQLERRVRPISKYMVFCFDGKKLSIKNHKNDRCGF